MNASLPGAPATVAPQPYPDDDADDEAVVRHQRSDIRDRGALDALGRAIASPVIDGARGQDPFLPGPAAHDVPPKPQR